LGLPIAPPTGLTPAGPAAGAVVATTATRVEAALG
jgi:hypothetical protein